MSDQPEDVSNLRPSCVYGPVPSRRLGRSLGIDVVPFKMCSYDCVYCQLGRTRARTVRRGRWVEIDDIVTGVRERLAEAPDLITFAGSGEPTLFEGIGEAIGAVKDLTDIPVAVLTNGSLLSCAEVRRDLAAADIVVPSLDAPDERLFAWVNRPHASLDFDEVVDGMVTFREQHGGEMWLEVFLLAGVTGIDAEVERLATLAARIAPDRIQLNTVVRPPAEEWAQPVLDDRLREFASVFTPAAEVLVSEAAPAVPADAADDGDIASLLARRPCTVTDIAVGLSINPTVALKRVESLVAGGSVRRCVHDGRLYYMAADAAQKHTSRGGIMKVAISAQSNDIEALVDPRFGRAAWFIVADTESDEWSAHDNRENAGASGGAGVQAGTTVVGLGVQAVVTGNVGPNAYKVLSTAGIDVRQAGNGVTVREALAALRGGDLPAVGGATVSGHWG